MTVEEIEELYLKRGAVTTKISQKVKASGTRYMLPLEGREIEVIYYEAGRKNAPLIVGMHGGGFLMGGCAFDDAMWDAMRNELEVNIVSIGYRKTPEHRYPDALNDVYESICYIMEQMPKLDFDRKRVSVFGNSAGGNLAAAVCLLAKEKGKPVFEYQILNYPFLDVYTDDSKKPGADPDGDFTVARLFNKLYVNEEDAVQPLVSPVYAKPEQLEGLPKTIMTYAEHDTLRYEAQEYTKNLREAGVEVVERTASQMPHAFFEIAFGKINKMTSSKEIWTLYEQGKLQEEVKATMAFIRNNI